MAADKELTSLMNSLEGTFAPESIEHELEEHGYEIELQDSNEPPLEDHRSRGRTALYQVRDPEENYQFQIKAFVDPYTPKMSLEVILE